jgi:hypothetical protein
MSAFSDYLENKVLDHLLGATTYTAPGTVYFALYTSAPSDGGGGTEVSGGSYARVAVTNNATNWPAAISGLKRNNIIITFPEATGSWGAIVGVGILDAATAGNLLFWTTITSRTVVQGDIPRFNAQGVSISLN